MTVGSERGDLVFVGDVHIDRDDADLEAFLAFLDRLSATTSRLILIGDLFNLWIGRRELEQPHHRVVLDRLAALRRRGMIVRYLEGNRDYRIGACYASAAEPAASRGLDDSTDGGIVETFGGHRLFAVHGDLANQSDRQYRAWRWFSRSALVWTLFNLLPTTRRQRFAESVETRMRSTNVAFRGAFPEQAVRDYASRFFRRGHDIVVLGHFHLERDLAALPPEQQGRILVLPEWKGSRRHLEVRADGRVGFVDSPS